MKTVFTYLLLFNLLLLSSGFAEERHDLNVSDELTFFTEEGDLDLSHYLSQAYGFLPVPIIITEPAIGYGGGAAIVYLHDKFVGRKGASGRNIPPSMSGLILAATENGTKIAGGFHLGYYLEDRLRTQTFVMLTNVNINFYTPAGRAIFMNLKSPIAYQSLKYRMGESDVFLGAAYLYTSSELKLNREDEDKDILREPYKVTSSALGLIFDYDTRDNALSPNKGMLFNARANFFFESIGSDNEFQKYFFQELLYVPLTEKINLDHRFVFDKVVGEEAPFYMYPAVNMRGVPAMRYQGENVALYEAQLTYDLNERWSAVLFGGVARAYGERKNILGDKSVSFGDAPTVVSKGVGFRYLIAEKFGLRMGIDVAMSNEDKAFYIQFGTAWMGL
jgi:outer membrane protein assembly factor BamA